MDYRFKSIDFNLENFINKKGNTMPEYLPWYKAFFFLLNDEWALKSSLRINEWSPNVGQSANEKDETSFQQACYNIICLDFE